MDHTATMRTGKMIPDDASSIETRSLVASAKVGDREAFSVLASIYRNRILSVARRMLKNLEDAEDVTQQTLMKAFLNIGDFKGSCAFSTWVTRIAINEALMWKRRLRAHREVSWSGSPEIEESGIVPEAPDHRPNPEQSYASQESHQILRTAIHHLEPRSREALEFRGLNEGSIKDLALAQGTSIASAKSRLFRGRRILRAKLTYLIHDMPCQGVRSRRQAA
jgi:RNA polymerase sigma-70 factor, ECF subfamily